MPLPAPLHTARLSLTPLDAAQVGPFHVLATDPHVRRYLMDGQVVAQAWADEQVAASQARFEAGGIGLWLASDRDGADPIGFCGFLALPDTGLDNELVYALRERATGRGLATEMARAMITLSDARPISASVDAVNAASVRILEGLGFRRTDVRPGAFGELLLYELR